DAEADSKREGISGKYIPAVIKQIRDNRRIGAVLVRINSPGGSAVASEKIHRELALLAKEKHVIISFSDVAASGGYYIACAGHRILSNQTTLTGSIGVIMGKFNLKGVMNKYGIT